MTLVGATLGRQPFTFYGAGSPSGSVTPTGYGDRYIDTTGGVAYTAVGLTNTDWATDAGGVSSSAFLTTHTPTMEFATTPATAWNHTTQTCRHKIVGNVGFFLIEVGADLTTKGAAAGYFYLTLPFTARNSLQGVFPVLNKAADFTYPTSSADLLAAPVGNTNRLAFSASKSAAISETVDAGDFVEGDSYRFLVAGFVEIA